MSRSPTQMFIVFQYFGRVSRAALFEHPQTRLYLRYASVNNCKSVDCPLLDLMCTEQNRTDKKRSVRQIGVPGDLTLNRNNISIEWDDCYPRRNKSVYAIGVRGFFVFCYHLSPQRLNRF